MRVSGVLGLSVLIVATLLGGCAGGAVHYADGSALPQDGAASDVQKPVVDARNKSDFEAVAADINKQMQTGGRWQYVNDTERQKLATGFSSMRTLFDQYGTVDKMGPVARDRLLAAQNEVNEILTRSDGNRLVCEYTRPVGTHFPVKTCKTYAQSEREAHQAAQELEKQMQTQPRGLQCGPGQC